jgi:hypothetical protein
MKDKIVFEHSFVVNEGDNGGESLIITTKSINNGSNTYLNQEITLTSYCNSASFNLSSAVLTPAKLRELANQLESVINSTRSKS